MFSLVDPACTQTDCGLANVGGRFVSEADLIFVCSCNSITLSMASRVPMALRALGRDPSRLGRIASAPHRALCTPPASTPPAPPPLASTSALGSIPPTGDKRFVRIAGASSYAGVDDIKHFMRTNGVDIPSDVESTSKSMLNDKPLPALAQGQADVFQNHSVWVYDAGSQEEAREVSDKLAGKVVGMKLARASTVDSTLVAGMFGERTPNSSFKRKSTLRSRMAIISPAVEERGRTVLVTKLESNMSPRQLWAFFSTFDVIDVKMLRRSGVAAVVMRTKEEAVRAIRERSNIIMQNRCRVHIKMFE